MSAAENIDFRDMDLERYFKEVSELGAAYIPRFINTETLGELQKLCGEIEYEEIANIYENVSERYYVPEYIPPGKDRYFTVLGERLQQRFAAHEAQFPALADWQPNEYSIQLYDGTSYITSHRDQASYTGIIVVVSIQGEANFEVREKRHAETIATWRVEAGDTIILRARDFNPSIKGHPGVFHVVSGALTSTARISVGFRQR